MLAVSSGFAQVPAGCRPAPAPAPTPAPPADPPCQRRGGTREPRCSPAPAAGAGCKRRAGGCGDPGAGGRPGPSLVRKAALCPPCAAPGPRLCPAWAALTRAASITPPTANSNSQKVETNRIRPGPSSHHPARDPPSARLIQFLKHRAMSGILT